jgi:hypothetical protein
MFSSQHFSTGGDELNENCYDKDAQTQQELSEQGKTLEQALDTFTQVSLFSLYVHLLSSRYSSLPASRPPSAMFCLPLFFQSLFGSF